MRTAITTTGSSVGHRGGRRLHRWTTHARTTLTASLVVVAVMAASCGGSDGGAKADKQTAGKDPCKVLTKAELAARLNVRPGAPARLALKLPSDPQPMGIPGARWCEFTSGSTVADVGLVTEYAGAAYNKFKGEAGGADKRRPTPVKGLARKALWDPDGRGMVVLVGDKLLALKVVTPEGDRRNWHRRLALLADKGRERL